MIPPRTLNFLVKVLPFKTPSLLLQTAQRLGDVFSVVIVPRTTYPVIAPLPVISMASHAICTELNLPESGRANVARDTVTHGTVLPVVIEPQPANVANILVPYVDPPLTPLSSVMPPHDLLPIITPFIPDEWEKALKHLGPLKNWVDNFVFFRFPISFDSGFPTFSYSLAEIYDLATCLGWPWKSSKMRPFNSQFKYSGFLWNLSTKMV
jgi:hypothetical protein